MSLVMCIGLNRLSSPTLPKCIMLIFTSTHMVPYPCRAVPWHTVPYVPYRTAPHHTILEHTTRFRYMFCITVPYRTALHCAAQLVLWLLDFLFSRFIDLLVWFVCVLIVLWLCIFVITLCTSCGCQSHGCKPLATRHGTRVQNFLAQIETERD